MPMDWNPNEQDIYAGFSDILLPTNSFDLGSGIRISKTFIHVFGAYMAAFKEPLLGSFHPAPWKSVAGGSSFDVRAELFIPKSTALFQGIDRLNTVWLIAALLRLKAVSSLRVPVISNLMFSEIAESQQEANFLPIELTTKNLISEPLPMRPFDFDHLEWVKTSLSISGKLFETNEKYSFSLLCLDRSISETRYSLALMTLWGALEQLFSPDDKQELSYRISLNIASYLRQRGEKRTTLFKMVRRLYTARSKAAHGNPTEDSKEFLETYNLLKEVFLKMTQENHVPTQADFEKFILEM
jgi:hypothetical protein